MAADGRQRAVDLATGPLGDALDRLLSRHHRLAVAVSGGSDSVALMHLLAARARLRPQLFDTTTIVTVDHRLRPASAAEARSVGNMARAAGFRHHATLTWDAPHPATGIQAAAREARYRLLGAYCRDHDIPALLTAHTRDDQAETVLMRLARGTGIDGLGGMDQVRRLENGVLHLRPLLDTTHEVLQAYLRTIGAAWIDDPSNDNPAFERIRWRKARSHLDDLGLTDQALVLTATRAARASAGLDWATVRLVHDAGPACRWSPLGYAVLSRQWLTALPAEFRVRILGSLIETLGGEGTAPPLAALEALCNGFCNSSGPMRRGFTLHGAMVRANADKVTVLREAIGSRRGSILPTHISALSIALGETVTWDGRFTIHLAASAAEPATIGPLGAAGLARLRASGASCTAGIPARVLWSLPAFTFPVAGLAVPHLGVWPSPILPAMVQISPFRDPFELATNAEAGSPPS